MIITTKEHIILVYILEGGLFWIIIDRHDGNIIIIIISYYFSRYWFKTTAKLND